MCETPALLSAQPRLFRGSFFKLWCCGISGFNQKGSGSAQWQGFWTEVLRPGYKVRSCAWSQDDFMVTHSFGSMAFHDIPARLTQACRWPTFCHNAVQGVQVWLAADMPLIPLAAHVQLLFVVHAAVPRTNLTNGSLCYKLQHDLLQQDLARQGVLPSTSRRVRELPACKPSSQTVVFTSASSAVRITALASSLTSSTTASARSTAVAGPPPGQGGVYGTRSCGGTQP